MNKRRTDTEFVTDAQLAAKRDQIAEEWATEYALEDSPWGWDVVRIAARASMAAVPVATCTITRIYGEGEK